MSKIKNCLAMVMAIVLIGVTPSMNVQASTNAPYGFQWIDSQAKLQHVQYYEYDAKANSYKISDRVAINGKSMYDIAGLLVMADVKAFEKKQPTVTVNSKGWYVISQSGEIRYMEESLDNTYAVATGVTAQAQYFINDHDDLGESVMLTDGTTKKLSALVFSGSVSRHTDSSAASGSYVETYAVGGNAEKIGYKAYFKNNLKVTTTCSNSTVYVEQVKKKISKTSKGGKFVGYNSEYSILVYDLVGKVFEYKYADGFSEAHEILEGEVVYCFEKNDKDFIKEIVTDKGRHPISEVIKEPKKVNTKKVTKVKNFNAKSMAYNGKTLIGTLSAKNGYLEWKGNQLSKSIGATKFGVSSKGSPVWMLSSKNAYYYNGKSVKLLAKNVIDLKTDKSGRMVKYKAKVKGKIKWIKITV